MMASFAAAARAVPTRASSRPAAPSASRAVVVAAGAGTPIKFAKSGGDRRRDRRVLRAPPARVASEECTPPSVEDANLTVVVDGASDPANTVISVRATNRPGILQLMKMTLQDLGLTVERTEVDMDSDGVVSDTFYVTGDDGIRVEDPYDLANIEQVLVTCVLNAHYLQVERARRGRLTATCSEARADRKASTTLGRRTCCTR